MASMMSQVRYNVMNLKISRLIAALATLLLVYFVFRVMRAPADPGQGPYGASKVTANRGDNVDFMRYMDAMIDTRPSRCLKDNAAETDSSVTIIIHYNEDEVYDAKLTLYSVIENTEPHKYKEVVFLDDGSESVGPQATMFLNEKRFSKVRAFKSHVADGQASSKFKSSKLANGNILVFLSSKTIVNKGWLTPLVNAVQEQKNLIAASHVDNFLSGYRFFENKPNLVNVMSLTLGTYYYERPDITDKENVNYIDTPVLRGDAFAVRRQYLQEIGDLDEKIAVGGGDILELSLRTWMCGGEIKIIPCSRVATHDALEALTVDNPESVRRISNLWLGIVKHLVYNQAMIPFRLHEDADDFSEDIVMLRMRKKQLDQLHGSKCRDFNWYHEKVAKYLVLPNALPVHFGTLSDRNNLCIQRSTDIYEEKLDVVQCRPHTYDPRKMVEMTPTGLFMMADRCIRVAQNGHVTLGQCKGEEEYERWEVNLSGKVFIRDQRERCLTHSMERNRNNELVHFLSLEKCQDSREQLWKFRSF